MHHRCYSETGAGDDEVLVNYQLAINQDNGITLGAKVIVSPDEASRIVSATTQNRCRFRCGTRLSARAVGVGARMTRYTGWHAVSPAGH